MNNAQFIVLEVLILILVIFASAAVITQINLTKCNSAKNPWCYTDWKCLNATTGAPEPVNSIGTIIANCSPITAERAALLNSHGCKNVAPGRGPNDIWVNCSPSNQGPCPAYGPGDVDWTTCKPPQTLLSSFSNTCANPPPPQAAPLT